MVDRLVAYGPVAVRRQPSLASPPEMTLQRLLSRKAPLGFEFRESMVLRRINGGDGDRGGAPTQCPRARAGRRSSWRRGVAQGGNGPDHHRDSTRSPGALLRTLRSTNTIENLNGSIKRATRNVNRWRSGSMILRWAVTALIEAESRFRRVRGPPSRQPRRGAQCRSLSGSPSTSNAGVQRITSLHLHRRL